MVPLKSSLERFIGTPLTESHHIVWSLKSSLERFIVLVCLFYSTCLVALKSSLERFIDVNVHLCVFVPLFKIQFGEIYSYWKIQYYYLHSSLKSSLERFIVKKETKLVDADTSLKSSLERFIESIKRGKLQLWYL